MRVKHRKKNPPPQQVHQSSARLLPLRYGSDPGLPGHSPYLSLRIRCALHRHHRQRGQDPVAFIDLLGHSGEHPFPASASSSVNRESSLSASWVPGGIAAPSPAGHPVWALVTRSRPVLACFHVPSRCRCPRSTSSRAYQSSVARICPAYSGPAPGPPWRRPSSKPGVEAAARGERHAQAKRLARSAARLHTDVGRPPHTALQSVKPVPQLDLVALRHVELCVSHPI